MFQWGEGSLTDFLFTIQEMRFLIYTFIATIAIVNVVLLGILYFVGDKRGVVKAVAVIMIGDAISSLLLALTAGESPIVGIDTLRPWIVSSRFILAGGLFAYFLLLLRMLWDRAVVDKERPVHE